MPDAQPDPAAITERLERINADLKSYRAMIRAQGVGHQPAAVYVTKYVEDVEFLMGLSTSTPAPAQPPPKTELETTLEQDAAGRVERKRT